MKQPWPGMARTIYNNHKRFEDVYFSKFNGYYLTGDGKSSALLIEYLLDPVKTRVDKVNTGLSIRDSKRCFDTYDG